MATGTGDGWRYPGPPVPASLTACAVQNVETKTGRRSSERDWPPARSASRSATGALRVTIVTWAERSYHRHRRQAALGRLAPECGTIMTTPAAQAA
jgi:hypothetical protein